MKLQQWLWPLKIPSHHKRVAAVPCEIVMLICTVHSWEDTVEWEDKRASWRSCLWRVYCWTAATKGSSIYSISISTSTFSTPSSSSSSSSSVALSRSLSHCRLQLGYRADFSFWNVSLSYFQPSQARFIVIHHGLVIETRARKKLVFEKNVFRLVGFLGFSVHCTMKTGHKITTQENIVL